MSKWVSEYIVTLKDYDDLDQFYIDIETEGTNLEFIPSRNVQCTVRRPISRNTYYMLTSAEARLLRKDPRVEDVSFAVPTAQKTSFAKQTGNWSRGSTNGIGQKNWGLYRMQLAQNEGSWGSDLGDPDRNSTIKISGTGKNVDVIVVDTVLYPDHPELTGRVVTYDWFREHDLVVRGTATTIVSVARISNVATITTSTPHRLVNGYIIDVVCTTDSSFNAASASVINIISDTEFQYSNTGNNTTSAPGEGFWRGVYQYPSYSGANNHATAVAGVIAGATQGWARGANIYNLRHDTESFFDGEYTPPDLLIDYIRQFHATKQINPETGRRNPTLVNNSWGFTRNLSFLDNLYTGNPSYSKLFYRESLVVPASPAVDTGISGIFSSSASAGSFPTVEAGNAFSVTTDATVATTNSITLVENGTAGLTNLGAPGGINAFGIDDNDDAIWQLSLPFQISYLGSSYQNNVYVSSNSFISIGGFYNNIPEFSADFPAINKIYLSAGDRNVENMWAGTIGTAPNRTYVVRYEGWDGAYSSLYEATNTLIWEVVFYEAIPNRIDVRFIENSVFRPEYTTTEIASYGVVIDGPAIPVRVASVDADIADAINEGIIFVGAAGNSRTKVDVAAGADYNNYIVENGEVIHYHRGSSPANSHPSLISVGALSSTNQEPKFSLSNTGPGVDIYAPGADVTSSIFDDIGIQGTDYIDEGAGQVYKKWSDSSIASAQVSGILALALETYPDMTQSEAKAYILNYAKTGLMSDTAGSYNDTTSLQGGPNKIAYFHKERPDTGLAIPKSRQWLRPATGQVYPRPVIRKK